MGDCCKTRDGVAAVVELRRIATNTMTKSLAEDPGYTQGAIGRVVGGEESRIAFNARHPTCAPGVIESGQVALETKASSVPGVFRNVGSDNFAHIIMQMFVQW